MIARQIKSGPRITSGLPTTRPESSHPVRTDERRHGVGTGENGQ